MSVFISITGLTARIHTLPNRPPFMTSADMAEAYGTTPKRIGEQVERNADRFPEDFCFRLTLEEAGKWSQNATTSQGKRADLQPLVFTHAGALALSGVLKTDTAAKVSVEIHRAFAEIEMRAQASTEMLLVKLRSDVLKMRGLRIYVVQGCQGGFNFETIWRMTSAPKAKMALVAHECVALGLIERLPPGTPEMSIEFGGYGDLFGGQAHG